MLTQAKHGLLKSVFKRYFSWRLDALTGHQVALLDYPVSLEPRYPPGGDAHPRLVPWFRDGEAACRATLESFAPFAGDLARIPQTSTSDVEPRWGNSFFSALDATALYAMLASRRPALLLEVGSGTSTLFAAEAIRRHQLNTRLVSIDPQPRRAIDQVCTEVIRQPFEALPLSTFDRLRPGDILFIDSSHRCLMNSDVTALFLEILPGLPHGVIVHFHDIFLPWDYPAFWGSRYYSEQYLLAAWLMGAAPPCRLLLSNTFASLHAPLRAEVDRVFGRTALAPILHDPATYRFVPGLLGTSLWVELTR